MVYSHVRLKVKVSKNISYFPGFYNTVDSLTCFPSFRVRETFFPDIFESNWGLSYSFPMIVFRIILPLDCCRLLVFTGFRFLSKLPPF